MVLQLGALLVLFPYKLVQMLDLLLEAKMVL